MRLLNISMPLCQRMALPVPYTFLPSRNWRMENGSLKSFEASNGHTEKVKMSRGTRTCSQHVEFTLWPWSENSEDLLKTFDWTWCRPYLQEIRLQLDVGSSPSPVWRANKRISGSATETKHFATPHAVSMVDGWILVLTEIMRTSHLFAEKQGSFWHPNKTWWCLWCLQTCSSNPLDMVDLVIVGTSYFCGILSPAPNFRLCQGTTSSGHVRIKSVMDAGGARLNGFKSFGAEKNRHEFNQRVRRFSKVANIF